MANSNRLKLVYNIFLLFILVSIIAIIYIYPDVRFIIESGKRYQGIGMTGTNEELLYLSRINGIYKGSLNLSDIYCFEHQKDPWFRPFIGEFIIGNIGKILKIDIVTLDILMSAILNIIIAVLIFIFSYQLSKSIKWSIICGIAIIFGYNIFSANASILREIFITRTYAEPLWFLRPISPQFYYIPFLAALIYTHRAVDISASKKNILIAGITLGLLFYCNVYYWTFIYAGLGVLSVVFFCKKERKAAGSIFLIFLISIITAIPYVISTINVIKHPNYKYLQENYMMFSSRRLFLYLPYLAPAVIVASVFLLFKHKSRLFIVSFLVGGALCLNQQIITGKNILQQWSFYSNKTFLIISIILSFQAMFSGQLKFSQLIKLISNEVFKRTLFITALLFFTFTAFSQQSNYYYANKSIFLEKQNQAGAYKWLRENGNINEVVLADPYLDFTTYMTNYRLILTYTDKFSYIAEWPCMLISDEEVNCRILSALIFFGYSEDEIKEYLSYRYVHSYKYVDPNIMIYPHSKDEQADTTAMYKELSKSPPLELIKRYRVDYALIRNTDMFRFMGRYGNGLSEEYKDNSYTIFRIK